MKFSAVIAMGALCACGSDATQLPDNPQPSSSEITGESVYNLTSTWLEPDSAQLQLADLRGKPQVLALIYTTCQAACPRIIADMRHIESELGSAAEQVGFLLVSINPTRDTPARLDTFARENGLDLNRWTLLYGEAPQVRELAAILGVRYNKTTPLDFAHSNIITVLDNGGEIVYQQDGLDADPNDTLGEIKEHLDVST